MLHRELSKETSEKVSDLLKSLGSLLRVYHWDFMIESEVAKDAYFIARVVTTPGRHVASIQFGEPFLTKEKSHDERLKTVIHEMLHLHFAEMGDFYRRLADTNTSPQVAELFIGEMINKEELIVDDLSQCVGDLFIALGNEIDVIQELYQLFDEMCSWYESGKPQEIQGTEEIQETENQDSTVVLEEGNDSGIVKSEDEELEQLAGGPLGPDAIDHCAKRGRGRPKGSKNKSRKTETRVSGSLSRFQPCVSKRDTSKLNKISSSFSVKFPKKLC